jgi:chemotaxis signal transduction protein
MNSAAESSPTAVTENDLIEETSESSATAGFGKIVTFSLGGKNYGITAEGVSEVIQPLRLTALPRSPRNLLGIACLRGEIIAVLDLPRVLGDISPSPPTRLKLIVLNSRGDRIRIALPVDRIGEIVEHDRVGSIEPKNPPIILDPYSLERTLALD